MRYVVLFLRRDVTRWKPLNRRLRCLPLPILLRFCIAESRFAGVDVWPALPSYLIAVAVGLLDKRFETAGDDPLHDDQKARYLDAFGGQSDVCPVVFELVNAGERSTEL